MSIVESQRPIVWDLKLPCNFGRLKQNKWENAGDFVRLEAIEGDFGQFWPLKTNLRR